MENSLEAATDALIESVALAVMTAEGILADPHSDRLSELAQVVGAATAHGIESLMNFGANVVGMIGLSDRETAQMLSALIGFHAMLHDCGGEG